MRTRARVATVALFALSSLGGAALAPRALAGAPTVPDLVSISSSSSSSCAVRADGSVACWGSNWSGQLGNGTTYDSVIPQLAALDGAATEVTVGEAHACALMVDATLRCWGSNWSGQVGDLALGPDVPTPATVPGVDHAVSVGAGVYHTCAVRDDGTAWCWGIGYNGQLGQPGIWDPLPPTQVAGITTAVEVAAGDYHTCLRLEDGTVSCFGFFPVGENGFTEYTEPTPIAGFSNAIALAGGGDFACGLVASGRVKCFGGNWIGQLGDGTDIARTDAEPVLGIEDAVAVGAGSMHACAVLADGTVWCWGRQADGETGKPPTDDPWRQPVPEAVEGIEGATAVDAGFRFTCAVASGVGMCWGANEGGQLGDRTVVGHHVPAPLSWVPDSEAPVASEPTVAIRGDEYLSRDRFRVRITVPAEDDPAGTGIAQIEFRVSKDGGATWGQIHRRDQSWSKWVKPTGTVIFAVRAIDRVGNAGEWAQTPIMTPQLVQETSPAIVYAGSWSTLTRIRFSGDSGASTTEAGAEASITFTGRSFGLVSREARLAGEFQVFVDGEDAGIVDLKSRYRLFQRVVFARSWPTSGEHTVRMVALGTEGRPRVDLDAFIVID
jgi:alpha-tubulin suppressor-like RCC1 family protein